MTDLLSKYNIHGALKVPFTLGLVFAYGLRHLCLILFPPTRIAFETYTELFSLKPFLISDAIILCVIVLNMQRQPDASILVRKVWRHALWLVVGAYIFDTLLTVTLYGKTLLNSDHLYFNILAGSLLIDAIIVVYLLGTHSIKEVFFSFPEKASIEEAKPSLNKDNVPKKPTPSKNIASGALISSAVIKGYEFADFPFQSKDLNEQIIEIRKHLTNFSLAQAEKGLRTLLKKHPENAQLWHELGLVAFSADKLAQAEALILKSLEFDFENYLHWRNLGEIQRRMGNYDAAIESTMHAIKLMPDDVNAHYNLGLALWDAGRSDEALNAFNRAKSLHPEAKEQLIN